jgi:uncharacterized phage protein (TIGR02220 family)
LLTILAKRARRSPDLVTGLGVGEAYLGDVLRYGMTERGYRTAKKNLEKFNLATFKGTNKGTIGKLLNTSVYDINADESDEQSDEQATSDRRASDERPTTNKKDKKEKKDKNERIKDLSEAKRIINYLNTKIGSGYRHSKRSLDPISARLNEEFTFDDFKVVIDFKAKSWLGTDQAEYLRPETLFGNKFEGYLQAAKLRTSKFAGFDQTDYEGQAENEGFRTELAL